MIRSLAPRGPNREMLERLLQIEFPVTVVLAQRQSSLEEVLGLAVGSIIQFEKPASDPLHLMVGHCISAQGEAVKVGENYGLQISKVGSPRATLRQLGG